MSLDPCHHSDNEIKTRAYYLKLENYGKDDTDRYYIAKRITERLCEEKCIETVIEIEKPICALCDCRYGTIKAPYLPVTICWSCYWDHSKVELRKLCYPTKSSMVGFNC